MTCGTPTYIHLVLYVHMLRYLKVEDLSLNLKVNSYLCKCMYVCIHNLYVYYSFFNIESDNLGRKPENWISIK